MTIAVRFAKLALEVTPVFKRAKPYAPEEKARLMAEVEQRRRDGRTYRDIADELGISESCYHNWHRAGIKPATLRDEDPPRRAAVPRPYAAAERERLRAEVDTLRQAGKNVIAACREAGISEKSYRKWTIEAAPPPVMRPVELVTALVPVASHALTIVEPIVSSMLTLFAPGGYRLEGLTTDAAAELLRALA